MVQQMSPLLTDHHLPTAATRTSTKQLTQQIFLLDQAEQQQEEEEGGEEAGRGGGSSVRSQPGLVTPVRNTVAGPLSCPACRGDNGGQWPIDMIPD